MNQFRRGAIKGMLKDQTLFGETDKVDLTIRRIKLHEPPEGYYVAFSGGKDSCVILDLIKRAKVKFDAHLNITTVDPPELIRFVRQQYPEVIMEKPKISMKKLIEKKGILPTRLARYCCAEFKERGGTGRFVVTGVRHAESVRRSNRKLVEPCRQPTGKWFIHPVIDWSDDEVWEYIKTYNVPYCSLYDEGFKRIGCVCCPFASEKKKRQDIKRWPNIYKNQWRAGAELAMKRRKREGKKLLFNTVDEQMDFWISGKGLKKRAGAYQYFWRNERRTHYVI